MAETEAPKRIDVKFLEKFEEFVQFRNMRKGKSHLEVVAADAADKTPEESLESATRSYVKV